MNSLKSFEMNCGPGDITRGTRRTWVTEPTKSQEPASPVAFRPEELEDQLARILASGAFTKAERMSRFLRLVLQETINGNKNDLKEYTIGLAVFDRPASFDPQADSIVRGGARRLRTMLTDYYSDEGRLDPIHIELPKGGYIPLFTRGAQVPPELTDNPVIETVPSRPKHLVKVALIGGILLLAASPLLLLGLRQQAPTPEVSSIAVVPFRDLSPGQDQGALCEGLAEEFIHAFTRVSGMRVVGPGSTLRMRVDESAARRAGEQLNVDAVLHGSVQRAANRLRVWVRLVSVRDGSQILSTMYDREFTDVFAIQDDIVRSVVIALRGPSANQQGVTAIPPHSRNVEAWNLYMRGQFHDRRSTPGDMEKARVFFEQALRIDPKYALAYSGLSDIFTFRAADPKRQVESLRQSAALARKAVELEPNLPAARLSLATGRAYDWDWRGAEEEFQHALKLNPWFGLARIWYALFYLMPQGQTAGAVAEAREALRSDPLSPALHRDYGWILYLARDNETALRALLAAREFDAGMFVHLHLAKVYIQKKQFQQARQECQWPVRPDPVCVSISLAGLGRISEAEALMRKVQSDEGLRHRRGERIAEYYAFTDQKETALRRLEEAVETRSPLVPLALSAEPLYDSLRSTERFKVLARRVHDRQ
jgi:adenylate cyclase